MVYIPTPVPTALPATVHPIRAQAPARTAVTISDITTAAREVTTLAAKHPSWPQARVRSTVARALGVSTVQLRYLLRKASEL